MVRREKLLELEKLRDSSIIVYIGEISGEFIDLFHLYLSDLVKKGSNKLSIFLDTYGGNPTTGVNIINMSRQFFENVEIIIPNVAHSAGTLLCLGADEILMTTGASLSPIDPTTKNINIQPHTINLSEFKNFINNKLSDDVSSKNLLDSFYKTNNTNLLLSAFRAFNTVEYCAERLLKYHLNGDVDTTKKIINKLLLEQTLEHHYRIYREEARNIGLRIKNLSEEENSLALEIYNDIFIELQYNMSIEKRNYLGLMETSDCDTTIYYGRENGWQPQE